MPRKNLLTKKHLIPLIILILVLSVTLSGCTTQPQEPEANETENPEPETNETNNEQEPEGETKTTEEEPEEEPEEEETDSPPKIEVTELDLNPSTITKGEEVTIRAMVKNKGGQEGRKEINIIIDNSIIETKTIELSPDEENSIRITYPSDKVGIHRVEVGKNTDKFEVNEPVEFIYEALEVKPQIIESGEEAIITLKAKNPTEREGKGEISIYANNEEIEEESISLNPGETKEVKTTEKFEEKGTYTISGKNLERSLKVLEPTIKDSEVEIDYMLKTKYGSNSNLVINVTAPDSKEYKIRMKTGTITRSDTISKNQIDDGFYQAKISPPGPGDKIQTGEYELTLEDRQGKIYYKTNIEFYGPEIQIRDLKIDKEFNEEENLGTVNQIKMEIINSGDLPVNLKEGKVNIQEDSNRYDKIFTINLPIIETKGIYKLKIDTEVELEEEFKPGNYNINTEIYSENQKLAEKTKKINFTPEKNIYVDDIYIEPKEPAKNQKVNIKATVTNSGRESARKKIKLIINGETIDTRNVELESRESKELRFEVTREEPKEHTVKIGQKEGSFIIKDTEEEGLGREGGKEIYYNSEEDGKIWVYTQDIIHTGDYIIEPLDMSAPKEEIIVEVTNPEGQVKMVTVPQGEPTDVWKDEITIYLEKTFSGAEGTTRAKILITK